MLPGVAAHSMIIEIWGSSFARGAAALRQWARHERLAIEVEIEERKDKNN